MAARGFSLTTLTDGPYMLVASYMSPDDLCQADATCRLLRHLHRQPAGSWFVVGSHLFNGMELDTGRGGELELFGCQPSKGLAMVDWKARVRAFVEGTPCFSPPFGGQQIVHVVNPDEVAYCRTRLRTDLLKQSTHRGIYLEVEVLKNVDNLSLAVVDFEAGGRSSVTFSPETGAVLRERKVRESPRAIEGTYIHLLPAVAAGRRFEGRMGLYVRGGHLAFFRQWGSEVRMLPTPARGEDGATSSNGPVTEEEGEHLEEESASPDASTAQGVARRKAMPWETTGFVTDLGWAEGQKLSICLAFRDEGAYRVRITHVSDEPPINPDACAVAYNQSNWSLLYGDEDHPLAI